MLRLHRFTKIVTFLLAAARLIRSSSAEDEDHAAQCGLYLALSLTSTEDSTIWGIYAGKDYETGQMVGVPELAINTHNLRFNAMHQGISASMRSSLEFLEESFWVGDMAGARYELEVGRSIASIGGSGSLGAGAPKLTNANWNQRKTYQHAALGEKKGDSHPSRGAISPFYDAHLATLDQVKKGSEIFVDYGNFFDEEKEKDELQKDDYPRLDETVDQMIQFFAKHGSSLDEASKIEIYNFITKDVMSAAVGSEKARKIAKIWPRSPDELPAVKQAGGTLHYSQPTSFQTTDWLQEHGRCMDNLRSGASTVSKAGRGAFTTRAIREGSVVVPVPLLQIPDKAVLNMYTLVQDESGDLVRESDSIIGTQLLINYCFGHPTSKMLFVPTGSNAGLINHSDKPNAKLVWSSHPAHERHWLQLPPEELVSANNRYIGLMMEVVALRDIAEGEEVFIDYGKEWNEAWSKHETEWNTRIATGELPKEWPIRAVDMNSEYVSKPFQTLDELKQHPYPENIRLVAFIVLQHDGATGTREDPRRWEAPPAGKPFTTEHLVDCEVVDATTSADGLHLYTVRWTRNGETVFVKDVPHDTFTFVDQPGTSDQFTPSPFRHYIGIPDDIFPQGPWRNA